MLMIDKRISERGAELLEPFNESNVTNFRVTNASRQKIHLDTTKGISYLVFLPLGESVARPYNGTFQNERDFVGMGAYQAALSHS